MEAKDLITAVETCTDIIKALDPYSIRMDSSLTIQAFYTADKVRHLHKAEGIRMTISDNGYVEFKGDYKDIVDLRIVLTDR